MPKKIPTKKWENRLIAWIKDSSYYNDNTKTKIIQQIKKFKHEIPNYERAKELYKKSKNSTITDKERNELTSMLLKFDEYSESELKSIKELYKLKISHFNAENLAELETKKQNSNILSILHKQLKKIKPEIPKTKIKKNSKSDWIRSIYHPTLVKNSRKVKVKGLIVIAFVLSGFFVGILLYINIFHPFIFFDANKKKLDVNEEIFFNWNIIGGFSKGIIVFGDGFSMKLNDTSNIVKHSYSIQGKYAPVIHLWNQYGFSTSNSLFVEIKNNAPQFEVSVPNSAHEDELVRVNVVDLIESKVDLEDGVLKYVYGFADNNQTTSSQNSITHKWKTAGTYPVTISIFDDQGALSQKTEYIKIINTPPKAYFTYAIADAIVEFNGENSIDTENDYNSLMYIWDFGDNHSSFGKYVHHSYESSGQYTVKLCVKDDNGAVDYQSKTINIGPDETSTTDFNIVENKLELEVLGPYTLSQNIEGQLINLDVEIYDSLENEPTLAYSWYDENGVLISNDKKPAILLEDGDYRFSLNVSNQNGEIVSENITLNINNVAPEIFVSNYVYNGPNSGSNNMGKLKLTAYGYDSISDINKLKFYWKITEGDNIYTFGDESGKATSTMTFKCEETAIYRGQVKVVDPSGKESMATFFINSIIDNNINSVPDKIEQLLTITGESIDTFLDTDNDFISDKCEQLIFNTNYMNPDTDNDGLCDGLDSFGFGELTLGTSPTNDDTDFDLLIDSLEFYGWNTTINLFEGSKTFHVSSNPLISDTDLDGVSDYEEYQKGTNPGLRDSDGDLLDDLVDPFPANYDNDGDFLSDKVEIDIGTNLNNSDSDGDGINDGEEYYGWGLLGFKTNPLDADCDRDFASDGSEMKFYTVKLENSKGLDVRVNVSNPVSLNFPYMFQKAATAQISLALSFGEHGTSQTREYGVRDVDVKDLNVVVRHEGYDAVLFETTTDRTRYFSHVIDVREIMNNESLVFNYHGNYILEVDDPSAGCLVEQFELEFCRYLDPYNEDFDGDGILDGVEMNLLVEGTQKIDIKDMYNSTQRVMDSTTFNSNKTRTYSLEIPQIGRVFNAEINLEIESSGMLNPNTLVEFKLVKKYLNTTLRDSVLLEYSQQLNIANFLIYHKNLNLFDLLQTRSISDVYGEYVLIITLEHSQELLDQLILSEFFIETETFVDAGPLDSHAWLTDPALYDTDSDGWSDTYEIFTKNTNPLNEDTDGDGAIDPNDRDPLRNIVLEITPFKAAYRNQAWPTVDPELQIIMYFKINDLIDPGCIEEENKIGIRSVPLRTSSEPNGYGSNQVAWWTGDAESHYYIDISDDIKVQSNVIPFYFTLWERSIPVSDLNRFDGNWYSDTFILDPYNTNDFLRITRIGIFGQLDEIIVQVRKIALEKINTIAIYSENETLFNGHYQTQERTNVFQLHITDSGAGTPFVQGANAIVIPTSLFTNTVLNAYIENDRLDETILYSAIDGEFEFYSIDRDGNIVEDGCGDADFVFIRYELSSQEAMEILNLLITCATNQSLNENNEIITELEIVYQYVSSKLNGIKATGLNLPDTIAEFVLWGGGFESSPQGSKPEPFNPFFLWLFLCPIALIFVLTVIAITQLNNDTAFGSGLNILSFLANLIWVAIRAALIIFAYICLALEVLTISIIFLGIGAVLDVTSLFSGFNCEWGIDWTIPYGVDTKIAYIELEMFNYEVAVKAYINWTYWEYFDIYFPLLTMDSKLGSLLDEVIGAGNSISNPPELGCGYDHIGGLRYDFHAGYRQRPQGYAPTYVTLVLVSPSGSIYNYSMVETPGQSFDTYYKWVRFNRTIDFGIEFDFNERQGQWHYCFITQASVINITTRWPYCGYAIGPLFHDNRSYFISSYLEPYSGYIDYEFDFTATGCDFLDGLTPEQIYLKIKWPNEKINTFPMSLASTFTYEEMSFNTYSRTINFSNYISIDKPTTLNYYYEAVFSDGSVSVLWDYQTIDENSDSDEYIDDGEDFDYVLCWYEGPLLKPKITGSNKPPIIWKWYVEDLTWNRLMSDDSDFRVLAPVSDEFILRFWVYVEDPDGTHEQHWVNGFEFVPKLSLINLDNPDDPLEPIDMKWTGGNYGPGPKGYDEYFIDVFGDGHYAYKYEQTSDLIEYNFTSGAWTFAFEVADNQSHVTKELPNNKIWHAGSFENMKNTFFYGHPNGVGVEGIVGSIVISIGYMAMAYLASYQDTRLQIAAQVIAASIAVLDIVLNIVAFSNFMFATNDMGSLVGLGCHMFMKSIGFLIALSLSKNNVGTLNFNFLNTFSGYLMALVLLDLFCDVSGINWEENENGILVPSQENDPLTWNELLGGYPMMIVAFFGSIVGLTTSLVLTSGAARSDGGPEHIKIIMIVHTIISVVLSSFCFFTYFFKSGFFHIFNEM